MGFSIKELSYKDRHLIFLTEQELTGPWFSFILKGKKIGLIPIVLKNIEPTPIYKMVNTRKGSVIDRLTMDFDINEYLKKLMRLNEIPPFELKKEHSRIRLYIDVFNRPKVPYINTFFTMKNISDFALVDFSMYFVFDFDVNGLEGFDNDYSGYDTENDIIYQYDDTNLYAGFSPISRSTHFESCLTKDFKIDNDHLNLSNTLHQGKGEILSAIQIEFMTLEPNHTFQTALVISGGIGKEELFENMKAGKANAIKFLSQVNRSVKSEHRNIQAEAFIKINQQQSVDCNH
ncbi:MAG: hypothetical protein ACFFKA_15660 [Candidatus Thorarchaeota archaeon]